MSVEPSLAATGEIANTSKQFIKYVIQSGGAGSPEEIGASHGPVQVQPGVQSAKEGRCEGGYDFKDTCHEVVYIHGRPNRAC